MAHRSNRDNVLPRWPPAVDSGSSQILPLFLLIFHDCRQETCSATTNEAASAEHTWFADCQKQLLLSYTLFLGFSNHIPPWLAPARIKAGFSAGPLRLPGKVLSPRSDRKPCDRNPYRAVRAPAQRISAVQ